jgi:hypothetical protein
LGSRQRGDVRLRGQRGEVNFLAAKTSPIRLWHLPSPAHTKPNPLEREGLTSTVCKLFAFVFLPSPWHGILGSLEKGDVRLRGQKGEVIFHLQPILLKNITIY